MDFQNRVGSKPGSGGVASSQETNAARRERLRKLALETIDLARDPYFMKNHLGSYECKLCLTLHANEGSYLAHTQGKKHQANLARRAMKEARDSSDSPMATQANKVQIKKIALKIGKPGYKITKVRDPVSNQFGLLFQVQYPQISKEVKPLYRFMSSFEQKIEPPSKDHQYLLIAAEPYETIGFRVQSKDIDRSEGKFWTHWDPDSKNYSLQFFFKDKREETRGGSRKDPMNMDTEE